MKTIRKPGGKIKKQGKTLKKETVNQLLPKIE